MILKKKEAKRLLETIQQQKNEIDKLTNSYDFYSRIKNDKYLLHITGLTEISVCGKIIMTAKIIIGLEQDLINNRENYQQHILASIQAQASNTPYLDIDIKTARFNQQKLF